MNDHEYAHTHCIGMFPVTPKHEPETLEAIKRFEKIQHPVIKPTVDIKT